MGQKLNQPSRISITYCMNMNFDFLATEFLSNQVSDYLLASVTLIIGILSIKILRRIAFRNLKKLAAKTRNIYDDAIIRILEHNFIPIAYLGAFHLAIKNLNLHPILDRSVEVLIIILSTMLAIRLL